MEARARNSIFDFYFSFPLIIKSKRPGPPFFVWVQVPVPWADSIVYHQLSKVEWNILVDELFTLLMSHF